MKTLRTAVIGAGRIGWAFHIPQAKQHEGFDLVAVVDPLQERLDEAREEFDVKGYLDIESLFEAEQLDLVVIASPTHLHAEHTIAAFEIGCDVLCDKPMAIDLEEADRMIAAAGRTGRKLMVYQPHRTLSETRALQHILDSGLLGELYMIKRSLVHYRRRHDWQALTKYGGGMLNNYGAHMFDLLLYVTRSTLRSVDCYLRSVVTLGDADDVVKATVETESGVILDMDISMANPVNQPKWAVLGNRGAAYVNDDETEWRLRYVENLDAGTLHEELAAPGRSYVSGEELEWKEDFVPIGDFEPVDFYGKCYEYYAEAKAPFIPIEETREIMRALAAARASDADHRREGN